MKNQLIGLVLLWVAGFNQAPAQDVCQEFSTWFQANRSVADPATAYRSELISRGLTEAAAGKRFAELFRGVLSCPQFAVLPFDSLYSSEKAQLLAQPDAFLVESTKDVKPGRALDVAMGQGRNALYLAKAGWEVTGFDISSNGLSAARAAAGLAGVKIQRNACWPGCAPLVSCCSNISWRTSRATCQTGPEVPGARRASRAYWRVNRHSSTGPCSIA